ncbi:UDP-N-acetylglucosamine 2-epimerase [Sinomonas halotolerans]|uniref:UDP-N-acetylglucosamine 2-epimerase n=1 Tax=Sinomonas halotolerans TaxID=1644133 RepID=A0ABU9WWK1_9MICC
MRVLAFVGTRADLFPLGPVLRKLGENAGVGLHVATAVGFQEGAAAGQLLDAGLAGLAFEHHDLGLHLPEITVAAQAAAGAELSLRMSALLREVSPEALVVLGDRWELMYAVPPAVLSGTRVVHLHGGEVTEGALDERVRHAMTKLADQHCVSTAGAGRRVAQLGESADRIHVTGAPGLDRFAGVEPLSPQEFEEALGVPLVRPAVLATYHPPTAGSGVDVRASAEGLFGEVVAQAGSAVMTYPGFDAGRDEIIGVLEGIARSALPHVAVRENLGSLYPRVLATVDAVVGNSSSGILEAASFGLPVVNVGDRQKGRECGANVLHCAEDRQAVADAMRQALSPGFRALSSQTANPYGDSRAAGRIEGVIVNSGSTGLAKKFVDVEEGENSGDS